MGSISQKSEGGLVCWALMLGRKKEKEEVVVGQRRRRVLLLQLKPNAGPGEPVPASGMTAFQEVQLCRDRAITVAAGLRRRSVKEIDRPSLHAELDC